MAKEIKAPAPKPKVDCKDCNGTGLKDSDTLCPACEGSGKV